MKGAEAFVRYYMSQVERAYREPNARLLPPLLYTPKSCKLCRGHQVEVLEEVRRGYRIDDRPVALHSVLGDSLAALDSVRVYTCATQLAYRTLDRSGRVVSRAKRSDFGWQVIVVPTSKGWRVVDIRILTYKYSCPGGVAQVG